jgi:hypothetical protein
MYNIVCWVYLREDWQEVASFISVFRSRGTIPKKLNSRNLISAGLG